MSAESEFRLERKLRAEIESLSLDLAAAQKRANLLDQRLGDEARAHLGTQSRLNECQRQASVDRAESERRERTAREDAKQAERDAAAARRLAVGRASTADLAEANQRARRAEAERDAALLRIERARAALGEATHPTTTHPPR